MALEGDAVFSKPCCLSLRQPTGTKSQQRASKTADIFQICNVHEASKAHAAALCRAEGYKQGHQPGGQGNINQLNINSIPRLSVERNREHIQVVTYLVSFCENILLHRHWENEEALNKGKLLELLHLISNYNPNCCITVYPQNNCGIE